MNNIGKLTTFKRLLEEESVIMIPKVQRDYAYGRGRRFYGCMADSLQVIL